MSRPVIGIALPLRTMVVPKKTKGMCNILGPSSGPPGPVICTGFSPPPVVGTAPIFPLFLHFTQFLFRFSSSHRQICSSGSGLCSDVHPGDIWFGSQDVRVTVFVLLGSALRHLHA